MKTAREQIVQAASDLIENQGYHATGMNEIVSKAGLPRGRSIIISRKEKMQSPPKRLKLPGWCSQAGSAKTWMQPGNLAIAIQTFLDSIAHYVEYSGFTTGGPLAIVASETATTNEKLNQVCRGAYAEMISAFEEKFLISGCSAEKASSLAWITTSTIEGAIILSRTFHSGDPLRKAGRELSHLIRLTV